jgi:hypothetical protein
MKNTVPLIGAVGEAREWKKTVEAPARGLKKLRPAALGFLLGGAVLVVGGVLAMLFLHIFENIAMNIGLMPITGIPLPFVSYGGSNFMTNIVGIALVVNVVKSRSSTTQIMFQTKQRTKRRKRRKLLPIGAGS